MNKIWPFSMNFVLFAGIACVAPFFVLYYQSLGFTGAQIGLLTGITPLVTLFSAPLWTRFADITRRHRLIMNIALLLGVVTVIVFPFLQVFLPILLIVVLLNAFVAPVTPFTDTATMFMLGDEKEMYGRIRLGGTIGFGLAAPVAGALVQNYGLKYTFWACALFLFLAFLISQKLVYGQLQVDDSAARGNIRSLLANPRWLLFLTTALAGGVAAAAVNNYLFPYMKEMGANESTMGLALTMGVISEIPILFFVNRLIKRLKPYGLLMVSMIFSGARLLLFAASGTPGIVLFVQLLNGMTFPAMWVAGVSYADENAPTGMRTTAQGLFAAMVMGIGLAVGGFAGGLLLESMGGRGLYLVLGIFVLAVVAVVALIHSRLPAEQQARTDTALP